METEKQMNVLKRIAQDMHDDAIAFDGEPINGRTIGTCFGNQGAAIATLALIVESIIAKEQNKK